MKITRDLNLDVGYVKFRSGKITETVEVRPGVLLDLDKNGQVMGIEVLSLAELAPALTSSRKGKSPKKVPLGRRSRNVVAAVARKKRSI